MNISSGFQSLGPMYVMLFFFGGSRICYINVFIVLSSNKMVCKKCSKRFNGNKL